MLGVKKRKNADTVNFNDLFAGKSEDKEEDFLSSVSDEKIDRDSSFNILESGDVWKEDNSEFDFKFKKSPFGGYAKKSVEQYLNDQKSSMNNMIKNLEVQINDLTKEKESSYRECEVLREQMKKIQENADQAQIEALKIKEKYDDIDKSLKEKYDNLVNENIEYKEALEILKNENKNLEEKYEEVRNKSNVSEDLKKELYIKNEEIKRYKARVVESEGKIQNLNNQIENKSIELTNLKGQFIIQERKIEELSSDYEKKEKEFESINSEFIKQTEELSMLNKEYMNQSKTLNDLSNNYSAQTESLNAINIKYDKQFDDFSNLKKEYDDQSKRIIDIQEKYNNQIEKYNVLDENHKMQEQIFNTMKNEYEDQNIDRNNLRKLLEEKNADLKKQSMIIKEKDTALKERENEIRRMMEQKVYSSENKAKYEKLLYCLYEQEKKYEEANKKNTAYEEKISALESALNESMVKMKKWSNEYDSFMEQVKYNDNQLKNINEKYNKIYAENEELKKINSSLSSALNSNTEDSILDRTVIDTKERKEDKFQSKEYADFCKWIEKRQFDNI